VALRLTRSGVIGGVLAVLVAVVCVRLGLWQLERLDQRLARNAAYREAFALPILDLRGDTLEAVIRRPAGYVYRRARVVARPDAGREVVWRGRSLQGHPGVNILTPYPLDRGVVLVNRGWAASPDAAHVDLSRLGEPAAGAPVGILIPLTVGPSAAAPRVLELGGARVLTVQRPDPAVLAEHLPGLLPVYLQQVPTPGDPPAPTRLPIPDLTDRGPHLGYALQWFSFAAIACIGFLTVLFRRSRRAPR
jgi:surfeit locus 1 family protein